MKTNKQNSGNESTVLTAGKHTPGEWQECGQGTLLHPVSGAQVTTEVVELKDFGRIFEVYHYGNDPDGAQRLILAAPALLAALEDACPLLYHMANGQRVTGVDIAQAKAAFQQARMTIAQARPV